jgi:hypothetical protein
MSVLQLRAIIVRSEDPDVLKLYGLLTHLSERHHQPDQFPLENPSQADAQAVCKAIGTRVAKDQANKKGRQGNRVRLKLR